MARLSDKQAAEVALKSTGLAMARSPRAASSVLNPGIITDQASGTYLTYRIHVNSATQPQLAQWVFVDTQTADVRLPMLRTPGAHPQHLQHAARHKLRLGHPGAD